MAEETAEDISVMVGVMADAILTRHFMTSEEAWQLAGRVLCPIFDYAKPESYIAAMTAARQEYAGIASDGELRADFQGAVQELLYAGSLDSLERAVSDQAWQGLQRRRAVGV